MAKRRSLLSRANTSEFSVGIHDNVMITNVDINNRKGINGPINKMVYIKFAQLNESGKKIAESELSWWIPEITNDFFKTNFQEFCTQIHNVLEAYIGEEPAFDVFANVFDPIQIADQSELEDRKWKQSDFNKIVTNIKDAFAEAIAPYIGKSENLIRLKISSNYKGEDIEIPKYGKFVEPMSVGETKLSFTAAELKTHSKAGNVSVAAEAASSTNASV